MQLIDARCSYRLHLRFGRWYNFCQLDHRPTGERLQFGQTLRYPLLIAVDQLAYLCFEHRLLGRCVGSVARCTSSRERTCPCDTPEIKQSLALVLTYLCCLCFLAWTRYLQTRYPTSRLLGTLLLAPDTWSASSRERTCPCDTPEIKHSQALVLAPLCLER